MTTPYPNLRAFLRAAPETLAKGPIALVFAEDAVEIDTTLRHLNHLGFDKLLLIGPLRFEVAPDMAGKILRIDADPGIEDWVETHVNALIPHAVDQWMFYCYNAEFFFFPFCESRTVSEMIAFHAEERRDAMLTYVVDLYARDLDQHGNGVSIDTAHLDKSGYYAQKREDPAQNYAPKERQLNFHGGLRWRFEEYVPWEKRKIDRVSLFKAKRGLVLRDDHTFNDEEYNTYACPWHNNLTASMASFRTAKALKSNPGSTYDIRNFHWHNSVPFQWHSRQLLDLGLMEPGQWF